MTTNKTNASNQLPEEPENQPDNEINQKIVEYLSSSNDQEKRENASQLVELKNII